MNPFEPANLSPLPTDLAACELPYGLTWEDLRPSLPGFDDREGGQGQAFSSHAKQGLNGGPNSCILTLSYPVGKHVPHSITVFIKQQTDADKVEAQRYQLLASQGIPAPAVLAVFHKGEAEIILLEFLETIGIDFRSKGEVEGLLHLAARLNSVQAPPDFFKLTPGMPQDEFDRIVRTALDEIPSDPELPATDAPRWFAAYRASQKACQGMPLAVSHGEFFFQQVGWARRGPSRELVLFDLETLSLRPRFSDLASILYALSAYAGRGQSELFQVYLDRLCQLTRQDLRFDQAFQEFRLLRITESCYSLPWLIAEAKNPQSVDLNEQLAMTVRCLSEDLNALGLV